MSSSFNKRQQIDEQIDHAVVWSILFKRQISLSKYYCNPLRVDTNPKCRFTYYKGVLWFIDGGNAGKKAIDLYKFIQRKEGLNYNEALEYARYLYRTQGRKFSPVPNEIPLYETITNQRTAISSVVKLQYENKELKYWRPYDISGSNLLSDLVYPTLEFTIHSDRNQYTVHCQYPTYSIYYPRDRNSIKIFQPFYPIRKWTTNTSPSHLAGDFNIHLPYLLVTKSYKDYRVLSNAGYNTCYVQSETVDVHMLLEIAKVTTLIFCYDRDSTGFKSVANIIKEFYDLSIKAYGLVIPKGEYDDPASYYKYLRDKSQFRRFYDTNISSIVGRNA